MKKLIFSIFFTLLLFNLSFNGCSDDTPTTNNNAGSVPDPPVLISPLNGSLDSSMSGTFSWDSSSGATSYKIQLATDTGFTINLTQSITGFTYYAYSGVMLTNETYYWRVKGINSTGEGNYSSHWSFRTPAVVSGSIQGNWILIYNGGTQLDVCPGEMVTFPNNVAGTATLTCPEQSPIDRAYSRNGFVLTYTSTGVQYEISFTTDNLLVLSGINNNRVLYYVQKPPDVNSGTANVGDDRNSNSRNSSE